MVVVVVVVVELVVVLAGTDEVPVPGVGFGGQTSRCPPRITITCAGILGIGMWDAQAAITS